jgi:enoyl-CoA hydratase/carnithine racemase
MADVILVERALSVAIVTMNLPEKRNALSLEMRETLLAVLEELEADRDCRAIVLTGAAGTFSSGGDISAMPGANALGTKMRLERAHRVVRLIAGSAKPYIAAVEGFAFGAGLSLAALCDHVVAARDAKFAASFNRIGLIPDLGLMWSLPGRVGSGKAKEMMLLGETIQAPEAERIGLVDRLTEPGEALAEACRRAEKFAAVAPVATAFTKSALTQGPVDLETVLKQEMIGQALLLGTDDHAEAKTAFFAKRPVSFKGT